MELILAAVAGLGAVALATSLRILREYERAVVFRLGRVRPLRGPGLVFLVPFGVERMERVSLRIIAMDVPAQDVITRDNVSVKVNAVLYFRVSDPTKAVLEIEDYLFATSQLAQTTLRSVIGQAELDEVLAEREKFNRILQQIIDEGTDVWGIDVTGVEVKDVDLPHEMKRVIARQAEAERERRAKVINAEGELQAASRLKDAARLLSLHPASLQLRFLQTATEIAAENNSTTLFPLPMDLLTPFGTPGMESAEESETIEELEARAKKSADEATGMTRELTSKLTGLGLIAGADMASRKERARRQAERLAGKEESVREEDESAEEAWLEAAEGEPEEGEE
ncbi:MAG: slipin family protein [Gemmatimonadota bacterium]|nr:slipin family protein [Gemmatimonadota bacterium]